MSVIWVGPNPFTNWKVEEQCFGNYATDELGIEVTPRSDEACRWCAQGWLHRAMIPRTLQAGFNRWLLHHYDGHPMTVLNDVKHWTPLDFAFAWEKFVLDLRTSPDTYGC